MSTRIVATYGPACADPARLGQLIAEGVDIFRINCSHGQPATHTRAVATVRQAAAEAGRNVAVLADLPGPKIRVGILPEPREMRAGEHVALQAAGRAAEPGVIPVEYPRLAAEVRPGDRVLLRDGLVELAVDRVFGDVVHATVRRGGTLLSRQGVNLPGASLSAAAPTVADLRHLRDMLGVGVELVALSFVRGANDIERLRTAIRAQDARAAIVAKIERPEALDNLAAILDATDVVMVARGDLGVEIGPELVPLAQKQIIAAANARTVPVITATEMLESMVGCARPTRAEVSDVANAVLDGTDAVMLSAETATGAYPVEAVGYARRICQTAESLTHAVAARPPLPRQPETLMLSKEAMATVFPSASTVAAGRGEQAPTRLSG